MLQQNIQSLEQMPMLSMVGHPPLPHMMPMTPPFLMNTAVRLQSPSAPTDTHSSVPAGTHRFQTRRLVPNRDISFTHHKREEEKEISPYVLSDFLQEGEEVMMRIIIGTEADGYPLFSVAVLQYDGSVLTVKACEDVPALVGTASDKAGALLYTFMDGLFAAKKLRRKFSIAPWKLCFVKREGKLIPLNKLRKRMD